MIKQIWSITLMNLRNLPERLGASLVIVVGLAGLQAADGTHCHAAVERPVVVSENQPQWNVIPQLDILCFQVAFIDRRNAEGNRTAPVERPGCGAHLEFFG